MNNQKSQPVGENAVYNVYKLVHVPTNETFYSKAIISQCVDVDRYLNKNINIAKKHKTPGYMLQRLRDTLRSEWGVQVVGKGLNKQSANDLKRKLINDDKNSGSMFMGK